MGAISSKEIETKIEDIAMQIEELSAMAGGMLYKDILNEISECLLIDFKPNIIERLENLRDRYSKEEFSYRGIIEKAIDIVDEVKNAKKSKFTYEWKGEYYGRIN